MRRDEVRKTSLVKFYYSLLFSFSIQPYEINKVLSQTYYRLYLYDYVSIYGIKAGDKETNDQFFHSFLSLQFPFILLTTKQLVLETKG